MQHFDLTIIGTGSGNSILDDRYAGMRVAICEQGTFGGTCLNVGCIPTKMFVTPPRWLRRCATPPGSVSTRTTGVRWGDIVSRVFGRIDPIALAASATAGPPRRHGVRRATGSPDASRWPLPVAHRDGTEFTSDKVVLAAGARSVIPPAIAQSDITFHTSDTPSCGCRNCPHLVIVGGGFVAAEFAHVFAALGSKVTLVLRGSTLLSHCDDDIGNGSPDIAARKWGVHSHRTVVRYRYHPGTRRRFDAARRRDPGRHRPHPNGDLLDAQLAGVEVTDGGRVVVDEYQRTAARGVFALGDVSSDYRVKQTSPTTRPGCGTICCRTGTTRTR